MSWIDIYGNIRVDCMDCGRFAIEGNTCYVCWILDGMVMNWSNTDPPTYRTPEETDEKLCDWNKVGKFGLVEDEF